MKQRTASKRPPAGRGLCDLPEDTAKLLRLCFDATPDSMSVFLPDGRFAYVNKATCRTLGYSARELIGKTPWGLTPHMKKVSGRRFWQAIKRKRVLTFETVHCRKDGTTFPVEITLGAIGRNFLTKYKDRKIPLWRMSHHTSLHGENHSFC